MRYFAYKFPTETVRLYLQTDDGKMWYSEELQESNYISTEELLNDNGNGAEVKELFEG